MQAFRAALAQYLIGDLEVADLETAIDASMSESENSAGELLTLLDDLFQSGRLPHQIYAILKRRIEQGEPVGGEERTQFQAPTQASPADPVPPADDATRIMPAGPQRPPDPAAAYSTQQTHPTGGSSTNPSTATGAPATGASATGAPTSPSGFSNVSAPAAQSGSNWSHPSQWSGAQQASQTIEIGTVIKGRFVLEEMVGQGGMGKVFKSRDLRKEEAQDRFPFVAVKILNEDFRKHPQALQALQRESRKAQDLAHPNVATVFDFDRDGENVYMTMELLEGESLDKFIKRHLLRGIPIGKAIDFVRSLADGLAYAHEKSVVHSDFKPANAFLTNKGVVKIFDFGIARAAKQPTDAEGEKTLFDAGELGALTPAYASCEMIEGSADPDPRDDVYALALVAYELMTGKHPFNKKSAVVARDSGMTPEPVKGLSRRQWRGLQKGLAFAREDRAVSVNAFMADLNPRKLPVPIIAAAAVVVLALSALLLLALPQYLESREVDSLISDITDGPDEVITARLPDLRTIRVEDASLFRDVFVDPDTQTLFIRYYERRMDNIWDPTGNRFDFPQAQVLLVELRTLFDDSVMVNDLEEQMLSSRDDKIAELQRELTAVLDAGAMVSEQGERNVTEVLQVFRQIDPQHERLSAVDIPIRFAQVAEQLLQSNELPLADSVVEQGFVFSPGDINLVNVQDSINNRRDSLAREGRVAEIEVILADAVNDADSSRLRAAFLELGNLDSDNPVLTATRQQVERSMASDLDRIQAQGDYAQGYILIQSFEGVASEQFIAERSGRLDAVAQQYLAQIENLFTQLQNAIDADRLEAGSGNAAGLLQELASMGASSARLADARTQIAGGYSRRAVRAQQNEEWDVAREQLRTGLALDLPVNVSSRLESELADIDRYEQVSEQTADEDRQRVQAEQRQQEIARIQTEFDQIMAKPTFAAPDAREALGTMQKLSDYQVTIADGRQRIASRLLGAVDALVSSDQFDPALELIQQSNQMFPEDAAFETARNRVLSTREERADVLARRQLDQLENRIADLLAAPDLNQAWDQSISQALSEYASIVGEGARELAARRTRVAELYVTDAQRQRENSRLVNAGQQLDRAQRFAPDLPSLLREREFLQTQQVALREQTAVRARDAEISNQKLGLEAEAAAGNMEAAIQILNQLSETVPNDAFVTSEGPAAIASGYAALGLKEVSKIDGLIAASRLLARARKFAADAPGVATLDRAIDSQVESNWEMVSGVMLGDKPLNVSAISDMVSEIRDAAPDQYAVLSPQLVDQIAAKVQQLSGSQQSAARRRLAEAQEIFPDLGGLASVVVGSTAAAEGDPCARQELIGNGGRPRGSCRDQLPGDNTGPPLVVLPAGGPFASPVAFSKYEITIRDYNIYCAQTGSCQSKAGNSKLPLTQVSAVEAQQFVRWLTGVSGASYRIPTPAEWEYAASANGQQPPKNFNCQVEQNNVLIKGISLLEVDTGKGNGWGLFNYVGNAQEWVRNGDSWQVRGGAYTNSLQQCDVSMSTSHSGKADDVTGFRVLRELG